MCTHERERLCLYTPWRINISAPHVHSNTLCVVPKDPHTFQQARACWCTHHICCDNTASAKLQLCTQKNPTYFPPSPGLPRLCTQQEYPTEAVSQYMSLAACLFQTLCSNLNKSYSFECLFPWKSHLLCLPNQQRPALLNNYVIIHILKREPPFERILFFSFFSESSCGSFEVPPVFRLFLGCMGGHGK